MHSSMTANHFKHLLPAVSTLLGWIYTISWSASFYPQPLLNWQRRSTSGASIDFPFLNLVGFFCYTISTTLFLYSPTVKAQYAERHPRSSETTVRFNDFAFGAHASLLIIVCYSQYYERLWGFNVPKSQRISRPVIGITTACVSMVIVIIAVVLASNGVTYQDPTKWAWIDVVYSLGNVKIVVTFVKYVPQAVLNYRRQSTTGWSIGTILLDVIGGVLSLAQLVIDASMQNDWSGLTGNPMKLGLANISIFFDVIFMLQHYVLYRHAQEPKENDKDVSREEHSPLLESV